MKLLAQSSAPCSRFAMPCGLRGDRTHMVELGCHPAASAYCRYRTAQTESIWVEALDTVEWHLSVAS